ncbi:cytochrome PufQ [Rhodobaculum claviforme]|uniref:Protein pufQ n=1 Tax=Rhodobaculum claviforme TaxID=1549854 RepID=A0A934TLA3_9RHOB|nr:cytochrome PufQ [Rhodobaculum claviforme]MBK5927937.1 protein pufQ [Rhodobaculum claviforme]
MTDHAFEVPAARAHCQRPSRTEFRVYFAVIFLATVPLATLTWAMALVRGGRLPERGPMARAWSQAHIITPMIFSA